MVERGSESEIDTFLEQRLAVKDSIAAWPRFLRDNAAGRIDSHQESTGLEGLTPSKERVARMLFDIGAIKFGEFRLKLHDEHPEAPLSPIYIDLRLLRRFPREKSAAIRIYQEMLRGLDFQLIADVPTAATPIATTLADRLEVGMVTPRTDTKKHGSGAKVDGLSPKDERKTAILIDDLVTRADSKIEAADTLRENGLLVYDVVVLIDRQQGGQEQLDKAGLRLHSAFTLEQILNFYLRTGKITQAQYSDTRERLQALNVYLPA